MKGGNLIAQTGASAGAGHNGLAGSADSGNLLPNFPAFLFLCAALDLPDVVCVHARAEEFAAEHRESFDIVTSRAVANLRMLSELCLPLVKPGGYFLAMKSVESDAETAEAAQALRLLGGRLERVEDYAIPGTEVRHRLLFIKKTAPTPKKYPRPFAKIKKNPL